MKLIDIEILESFRGLQTPEDSTFVKEYFTSFLAPLPKLLDDIQIAISSGIYKKLEYSAHAIKSSCLNIGATPIVELCAKMEKIGKEATSFDGAQDLYSKVIPLCENLKNEIYSLPEFK